MQIKIAVTTSQLQTPHGYERIPRVCDCTTNFSHMDVTSFKWIDDSLFKFNCTETFSRRMEMMMRDSSFLTFDRILKLADGLGFESSFPSSSSSCSKSATSLPSSMTRRLRTSFKNASLGSRFFILSIAKPSSGSGLGQGRLRQ